MQNTLSRLLTHVCVAAIAASTASLVGCNTQGEKEGAHASQPNQAVPEAAVPPDATAVDESDAAKEETSDPSTKTLEVPQQKDAAVASVLPLVDPGKTPHIKRLVIAADVENREPIVAESTKASDPVVAFLELKNESTSDAQVVVTFEHKSGKKVGFIELNVPKESPRYRTWGRTRNITEEGQWTAIVTTKTGEELARSTFFVTG